MRLGVGDDYCIPNVNDDGVERDDTTDRWDAVCFGQVRGREYMFFTNSRRNGK
jgi:hypothetical protein